jgi:hypothetical protein
MSYSPFSDSRSPDQVTSGDVIFGFRRGRWTSLHIVVITCDSLAVINGIDGDA